MHNKGIIMFNKPQVESHYKSSIYLYTNYGYCFHFNGFTSVILSESGSVLMINIYRAMSIVIPVNPWFKIVMAYSIKVNQSFLKI